MNPSVPTMPTDPFNNPLIMNNEQMLFIMTNYPQYMSNPQPIMQWLYETAIYHEQQQVVEEEYE